MEKGVSRISVSVPPELLTKFDDAAKRIGYEDRSKAMQAAMRNLVTESKWVCERKGTGVGAIAMIYGHHMKGLEEAITDIEHEYADAVISSMHAHLDEDNCLEIIAVRGGASEIQELTNELKTKRGIKQLKLAIVTI